MRNPKETALDPYGQALRDFADGDPSSTIVVHSDLGEHDDLHRTARVLHVNSQGRCAGRVRD